VVVTGTTASAHFRPLVPRAGQPAAGGTSIDSSSPNIAPVKAAPRITAKAKQRIDSIQNSPSAVPKTGTVQRLQSGRMISTIQSGASGSRIRWIPACSWIAASKWMRLRMRSLIQAVRA
jgi:hypothetical protein